LALGVEVYAAACAVIGNKLTGSMSLKRIIALIKLLSLR